MLRSLLAPLRNLQDHAHETNLNDDAQSNILVAPTTSGGNPLAGQVKSLVEELKLAEDTYSRITVKPNVASLSLLWVHKPCLADLALPSVCRRRATLWNIGCIS